MERNEGLSEHESEKAHSYQGYERMEAHEADINELLDDIDEDFREEETAGDTVQAGEVIPFVEESPQLVVSAEDHETAAAGNGAYTDTDEDIGSRDSFS